MTQLRRPQSLHILKSVNVADYHDCRAREEVCNMPRSCVLLVVRAVMWFGVEAFDATPSRGDSRTHPSLSHTTTLSTPTARSTIPSV